MAIAAVPVSWGTIREAAELYGVSTKTVRRWITSGQVAAKRIGPKLIRVNLNSLDELGTALQYAGGDA